MSSHARSIKHGSFVIERYYNYDTAALFRAWTDPAAKARWFNGPADKWTEVLREMDVRVGGRERAIGKFADGSESRFEALYFDIVPERRLVYTYDMYWQGKKISVSLASVEFVTQGKDGSRGSKLIVTEQHAFLDGYEDAGNRERGTQGLMDNLEVALAGGDTRVPRKA
ncbi:MAG TPA: SRPBCC family protein [Steroidobacteraceae bacterium]|nr:SRPBCC family protein [Steroidobacteraceae bacterium]